MCRGLLFCVKVPLTLVWFLISGTLSQGDKATPLMLKEGQLKYTNVTHTSVVITWPELFCPTDDGSGSTRPLGPADFARYRMLVEWEWEAESKRQFWARDNDPECSLVLYHCRLSQLRPNTAYIVTITIYDQSPDPDVNIGSDDVIFTTHREPVTDDMVETITFWLLSVGVPSFTLLLTVAVCLLIAKKCRLCCWSKKSKSHRVTTPGDRVEERGASRDREGASRDIEGASRDAQGALSERSDPTERHLGSVRVEHTQRVNNWLEDTHTDGLELASTYDHPYLSPVSSPYVPFQNTPQEPTNQNRPPLTPGTMRSRVGTTTSESEIITLSPLPPPTACQESYGHHGNSPRPPRHPPSSQLVQQLQRRQQQQQQQPQHLTLGRQESEASPYGNTGVNALLGNTRRMFPHLL